MWRVIRAMLPSKEKIRNPVSLVVGMSKDGVALAVTKSVAYYSIKHRKCWWSIEI